MFGDTRIPLLHDVGQAEGSLIARNEMQTEATDVAPGAAT